MYYAPYMSGPGIPRSEWQKHPRFPTQALLLESHAAFRGRSKWIIDRLRDLAPRGAIDARRRARWVQRMGTDFNWWRASMGAHERYEENKLYPYLAHRYQLSFAELTAGHRGLHDQAERIVSAFAEARADDGRERSLLSLLPLTQLIQELERHRDLLASHLELEEDLVIPLLLELPAEEFRRFRDTPIDRLLGSNGVGRGTAR